MIIVNDVQLDFSITSPTDMLRYRQAVKHMETEAENMTFPTLAPDDPEFFDAYIELLNSQLRMFGNFLDDVFGDGTAELLLTNNPDLDKIFEVEDALEEAFTAQGETFGKQMTERFNKYKPNRATRRSRK